MNMKQRLMILSIIGLVLILTFIGYGYAQLVVVGSNSSGIINLGPEPVVSSGSGGGNTSFDNTNIAYLNNTQTFTSQNTFTTTINLNSDVNGRTWSTCFSRQRTSADAYFAFLDLTTCTATECMEAPFNGSVTWLSVYHSSDTFVSDGLTNVSVRINGNETVLNNIYNTITGIQQQASDNIRRNIVDFNTSDSISVYADRLSGTYNYIGGACIGGYYDNTPI